MQTQIRGTFVLCWSQIEVEDESAPPLGVLAVGATWRWRGAAVRVDGPGDVLALGENREKADLRRHATRVAARLRGQAGIPGAAAWAEEDDDRLFDGGFSVTDGHRRYDAALIERADRDPLCMFVDGLPPRDRELWITHVDAAGTRRRRAAGRLPSMICFTPGTRIATPAGPRRVGELREDDLVMTRDDGPQRVRWIGWRRMSGARLVAMPHLRPVRLRSGAMGEARPDGDLTVSPLHRVLVRGPAAQALFGEDEVLVAARDLVNDHSILVDRRLREVTYVHLLLDRHSIVFANGIETETLHPATMEMTAVDQVQLMRLAQRMPVVARDPGRYGGFARRMLNTSEAAILKHAGGLPH